MWERSEAGPVMAYGDPGPRELGTKEQGEGGGVDGWWGEGEAGACGVIMGRIMEGWGSCGGGVESHIRVTDVGRVHSPVQIM